MICDVCSDLGFGDRPCSPDECGCRCHPWSMDDVPKIATRGAR